VTMNCVDGVESRRRFMFSDSLISRGTSFEIT
jgi:hypothetical protein